MRCRGVHEVRCFAWGLAALELSCQAIVGDLDDYTFARPGSADASGESGVGPVAAAACRDGERQCFRDGVQTCEDGRWGEAEPCTEPTPVCNGGACGAVRLSGGLVSLSGNLGAGNYRLVAHGFEALSAVCGNVNRQRVCVTGDIQP